jgi:ABC-type branched-subunit amino acid transport system ATPase component
MAKFGDLQKKWALVGAEARLREIQAEIAEIYGAFPVLRRRQGSGATATGGGRRRQFSAKGKAAISEGMRKYWARRKALAAKAAKNA